MEGASIAGFGALAQLAVAVDRYAQAEVAYPLVLLNIALFCELTEAGCKAINADFTNGLKIKALKTVADGIKYLNLNSKKANPRKACLATEEMLVRTAEFQELIGAHRLQIRELLQSNNHELDFCRYRLPLVEFEELIRHSQFRLQLVKNNFKQEKGVWRGIEIADAAFTGFKTAETDLIASLLAE